MSAVHFKLSPGKSLCSTALPGDLLTRTRSEVTCRDCIEWMHA